MQQQIQRSTKKLFLIDTKEEEESDSSEDSEFIRQAYRMSQGIPSV